ncbi:hypothetical protein IW261DRAFT_1436697 [Armillaria novae-zelandiae]|uniref:Protein kinase domain-containing protein n=1 Tax=Armillaria novae-zelandiae TaxID=153914 RepID=A0AA39PVD6_9AGAR|nr:hypothetical protein IW261DRAFT_1436697 [Armillaria novae-zelandiae]
MTEHRADVVKDIRDIPQVSLKAYENHILPLSIYHDHVNAIAQALEDDEVLKKFEGEEGLRWADFANDPQNNAPLEDETFKYMETIAAAIVAAARWVVPDGRGPTTVMECRPNQTTLSEGRNGGFRSDGHYRLLKSRRPDYVEDATSTKHIEPPDLIQKIGHKLACDRPALEEYKKGDKLKDQNDDFQKLVGNASQAMYADPTGRFMFGMTIENTTTRFWFFSRAIALVSEPFNFIKDYTHLIRYVLSLSFATTEELGYDLSVTRVAYPLPANPSEHTIQYDYHIGGKTYRTVECLSSFRASGLLSRATRVWTAYQINDPQHRKRALKDVWAPSNAQTELEIQLEIFKSIEKNHPEISQADREQYFMEILECEVVQTSQKCNDDMPVFVRKGLEIIGDLVLYNPETALVSRTMPGSSISTPTGASLGNPDADNIPQPLRLYKGRKHVRVVFADVGTPLSDIQQPCVLFKALSDALKGLHYLYMGHYVHRDISAGNIILCNGVGKISDLEYAKKFLSQGPVNDPKTGTPIYMAVEVQDAAYLFLHKSPTPIANSTYTLSGPDQVPFIHNYLHDIESLFWIGFHALFSTAPAKYSKASLSERVEQRTLFNAFFPHRLEGSAQRRHFFALSRHHEETVKAIPTEYHPVLAVLFFIRNTLVSNYAMLEIFGGFPQHDQFKQVYGKLSTPFADAAKNAYDGDTQSLFPDEAAIIARPTRALVYRETTDNGDRDEDQTYILNDLECTERYEEPPSKVRRKNGKTKEKAAVSSRNSYHTHREFVEGTQSGEKRKRE